MIHKLDASKYVMDGPIQQVKDTNLFESIRNKYNMAGSSNQLVIQKLSVMKAYRGGFYDN